MPIARFFATPAVSIGAGRTRLDRGSPVRRTVLPPLGPDWLVRISCQRELRRIMVCSARPAAHPATAPAGIERDQAVREFPRICPGAKSKSPQTTVKACIKLRTVQKLVRLPANHREWMCTARELDPRPYMTRMATP